MSFLLAAGFASLVVWLLLKAALLTALLITFVLGIAFGAGMVLVGIESVKKEEELR